MGEPGKGFSDSDLKEELELVTKLKEDIEEYRDNDKTDGEATAELLDSIDKQEEELVKYLNEHRPRRDEE